MLSLFATLGHSVVMIKRSSLLTAVHKKKLPPMPTAQRQRVIIKSSPRGRRSATAERQVGQAARSCGVKNSPTPTLKDPAQEVGNISTSPGQPAAPLGRSPRVPYSVRLVRVPGFPPPGELRPAPAKPRMNPQGRERGTNKALFTSHPSSQMCPFGEHDGRGTRGTQPLGLRALNPRSWPLRVGPVSRRPLGRRRGLEPLRPAAGVSMVPTEEGVEGRGRRSRGWLASAGGADGGCG